MAESKKKKIERASKIVAELKKEYPDSKCSLDFKTPHQLLVSTILSAQCTDERVNMVTRDLFKKYKKPEDFAKAELSNLEQDVRSTGFFRNKAKSIKKSAIDIVEKYDGKMPRTMEELVRLAGVGRKTASVVLGTAFGIADGVVVDTHVKRISKLLGLTANTSPDKIERDLMDLIDHKEWIIFSHLLIDHGRAICKARKPDCDNCVLAKYCPSAGKI